MNRTVLRAQLPAVASYLCLVLAGSALPSLSQADGFYHEGRFEHHEFREHDVRLFRPRELALWRAGAWHHEWHNGLYGWWWFAAGIWYYYERPVYPYPLVVASVTYVQPASGPNMPPPSISPQGTMVVAPPGAAIAYYYYCRPAHGYYPTVPQCPVPWRLVPASAPPPGPPPAPPVAASPYGGPPAAPPAAGAVYGPPPPQ